MRYLPILLSVLFLLPACSPAPESDNTFTVKLDGGYTLSAFPDEDNTELVLNSETVKAYELMTVTDYSFDVFQNDELVGQLELALYQADSGTLIFAESAFNGMLTLTLSHEGSPDTLRTVKYGEAVLPEPSDVPRMERYSPDTSLYIEGGGVYVKSGRSPLLEDMGSTVYQVKEPENGVLLETGDGFRLSVPLTAYGADKMVWYGAVCSSPLVDWETYYRGMKAVNFDATNDYMFLADGHYYAKPPDYDPCANIEGRYVYKTAASFVHRSAIEQNCGAYLRALGLYLMYTRIESYNERGFLLNPCRSLWLWNDYGIDAGFYDTRFNIDAVAALLSGKKAGSEPLIDLAITNAMESYLQYRETSRFTTSGSIWVPDYCNSDVTIFSTHCSLNHYLAEAMALINAGRVLERDDWISAAIEILDEIERSYEIWIKPDNDLWYAIDASGEMIRNDYVSVTYNDLVACVKLLNSMEQLEDYPGICRLLDSKEKWLESNNYGAYVLEHP